MAVACILLSAFAALVRAETCPMHSSSSSPALLQGSMKVQATLSVDERSKTSKKGVGLPSSTGYGATQLEALNASWFYSWGLKPKITVPDGVEFVPIVATAKYLQWSPASGCHDILGFNEPDHSGQANISVSEALKLWPQVLAKVPTNGRIGSPATAGNPVTGSWFPEFMAASPHVDFVAVHWYKGAKVDKFKSDIQEVIDKYQKPVWVTEFAPQTIAESTADPTKWSQAEVNEFIQEVVSWMESNSMVERYAWHDSKSGTSWLYDDAGGLSETGQVYAAS
ncbi:unnamed protein product [Effrenium voratum]|nr:unnamed protein product [Effrenium voratum]|mmetsp:Transcript_12121/g.28717  ORF Transcript_12121/g.28717 Transcript_12121/m.28717 type:complete len:281 (-) Transcript_12121:73-915(-)